MSEQAVKTITNSIIGAAAVFGVAAVGFSSYVATDESERHVISLFGEFQEVTEPGPNFKVPFFSEATPYSLRPEVVEVGPKSVASKGNQTLEQVRTSFQVRIPADAVETIHKRFPNYLSIVRDDATKVTNGVLGTIDTTVIADQRTLVETRMRTALQELIDEKGMGLVVETSSLQNFEWDPAFRDSIRENARVKNEIVRLEAEEQREIIEARKRVVIADGIANERRSQAAGEADAARTAADGAKDAAIATAEGEAFRIAAEGRARAEALAAEIEAFGGADAYNANVLYQQWNGDVPQIVSGDSGQGMLLDLRSIGAATPGPR